MSNKVKGYLSCILGTASWGISGICSQYFFENYAVTYDQVTVVKMVFASLIMLPILRVSKGKEIYAIFTNRHDVFLLLLFSVFGLLFCQYGYIAAHLLFKCANSYRDPVSRSDPDFSLPVYPPSVLA